ncbi:TIGR03084 family metal-binding protein [Micromonospora sp. WMMD1082]|uniref:TIGR03084 family metal-binding protein n=1 Tax=Micromonospora sp. WMMD1082 TaxID=3016104 RepID=UPI002416E85F|nr:TIGR03084 family metal-binding protein [Micromonospora sp. WMMD1082]MDG4793441.1 TIGR03084 family metal-binding protein [Micromonospora sp. WMMD1082]
MTQTNQVVADLTKEGDELDEIVARLDDADWDRPTPAPGWTVKHQVAHLAATFRLAAMATAQPEAFQNLLTQLGDDFDANVNAALQPYLAAPPQALLGRWRAERAAAEGALAKVAPEHLVPWLVRPLPAGVLAAAGMMELFAHGQDIADTVGVRPHRTDRIRHLVAFAARTWDFGYLVRGIDPPTQPIRLDVTAPSGAQWTFGPSDATQSVSGPAVDLCLLVTRRRHRADTALVAHGPDADRWLDIAQAYRGPAGPGRAPGQFAGARP